MFNILVCDDDKEIVDAIDIYLSQEGYHILKTYDGLQAIEIMKKEEESLKVYTVDNVLYIDSDRDRSISIYDVTGRTVQVVEIHEGNNTITGLSSGFYFLEGKKVAIK